MARHRKRSAWFAYYPEDFAGGTSGMTLAETGAFQKLLNHQFLHGSIPADDSRICRILGALPGEWAEVKAAVLAKFEDDDAGGMINRRMAGEREEREAIRQKRIVAGKDGAESRWNGKRDDKAIASAIILPMASTSTSTSISSEAITKSVPPAGGATWEGPDPISLEQAIAHGGICGVPQNVVEIWWHESAARGWVDHRGLPLRNPKHGLKAFGDKWRANEHRSASQGKLGRDRDHPREVWQIDKDIASIKHDMETVRAKHKKINGEGQSELTAKGETLMAPLREKMAKLKREKTK